MIRADDENKEPLVVRHNHKRHFFIFRMSEHAYLEIKPEIVESIEAIISKPRHYYFYSSQLRSIAHSFLVSYLLVERRRREMRPRLEVKLHAD